MRSYTRRNPNKDRSLPGKKRIRARRQASRQAAVLGADTAAPGPTAGTRTGRQPKAAERTFEKGSMALLSDRTLKLLTGAGIMGEAQLRNWSDERLLQIKGIGPKALEEIHARISN